APILWIAHPFANGGARSRKPGNGCMLQAEGLQE
ncbi:uncharacterized protein METZ01_LOCUS418251, partial [marine metagenome]